MYEDDPDQALIDGNGSPSDWDLITGGIYAYNQDPYTAYDNGTVNNSATGTGTASPAGTIAPPAGGSSYTPPNWLNGLLGAVGAVTNTATTLAPIINGKPVTSPAAAGQPVPVGSAKTVTVGGNSFSLTTIVLGIVALAAAAWFFFKKKK